jgi:tRNA/rRNA methyltransferase
MLDELTARLHEALTMSGYVHTEGVEEKLRRLLRRMHLRHDDAVMWLGMVRQILWKLNQRS